MLTVPELPVQSREGEYSILQLALPGRPPVNFAVLLLDPAADRLYLKAREDFAAIADEEDRELLELLAGDMARRAKETGARAFFEQLEDSLSNSLRITERSVTAVRDYAHTLDSLFREHVLEEARQSAPVLPFVTHLPVYTLRAAAGRFGDDMEVEPERWVAAPEGLRLTEDMFAAHIAGHSMEPEIPDGTLALFRYHPVGSRQGKRVLVWRRGASQAGGEFTIKVYESEKRMTEDGWQHTRIRLKPLNPAYEILELDENSEYIILGEYLRALPSPDLP